MSAPVSTVRVILSATCLAEAEAALPLATGLAAEAGAALAGVLIEDADNIALALAGAARFVDPAGRMLAGLDPARMGAAYARDAARFERLLARAATAAALSWSFRHTQGRLAEALAGIAAPGDLLVLPAGPMRAPLREIVLAAGADAALAPLAEAAAARLSRPLRRLAAPDLAQLGAGSVLFSQFEAQRLAALLAGTRCIHVLRS
ncbi:hypothetical protein [Rhodovulum steppense]|uniref:Universal stress protein family protein n=1 Tax=Rhodovulum steppense TaxID=540251 RepID=A0A4R1YK23_9RHOB|nr:hypothetical protein [Rhodovulum steppense]TCM77337.1 hypothetical protein EV216_13018 [Rhodovulum steppense]